VRWLFSFSTSWGITYRLLPPPLPLPLSSISGGYAQLRFFYGLLFSFLFLIMRWNGGDTHLSLFLFLLHFLGELRTSTGLPMSLNFPSTPPPWNGRERAWFPFFAGREDAFSGFSVSHVAFRSSYFPSFSFG